MSESYALIDAGRVANACNKYLEKRAKCIEATRANIVEHLFNSRVYWLLPYVPKGKRTRELIHTRLKHDIWHDYNLCKLSGGADAGIVEETLCLAREAYFETADTDVNLGSRVARILADADCL